MTRNAIGHSRRVVSLAVWLTSYCATMLLATAACSSSNRDELDTQFVEQAAGVCGVDVCIARQACSSWGRDTPDDGLGFTTAAPWTELSEASFWHCSPGCNWDDHNICPYVAVARRNELIATRIGISDAALNGLTVTAEAVYQEGFDIINSDCDNPWSPGCTIDRLYRCENHISGYPTPITAVRDWCPCAQVQPSTCLGGRAISAGGAHTCAILDGRLKCWGANASGELGNGSLVDSSQPVAVSGLSGTVNTVAAGGSHTCAIVAGAVKCWGQNIHGQLGNNATVSSAAPVEVTGLSSLAQGIAAGESHTCAIVGNTARCWGKNDFGQLGNNTLSNSGVPVPVSGLSNNVEAIAGGGSHTCAIVGGAARCWGLNNSGQLGNGTAGNPTPPNDSSVPVPVTGLASGVQAITAGLLHTCALVGGGVQCWGSNSNGQLGNNNASVNSSVPVPVTGLSTGVAVIAAGRFHTCAVLTNGAARCWGLNSSGQLGNGSVASSAVPVALTNLSNSLLVVTGHRHTCAASKGRFHCWGSNSNGQLAVTIDLEQVAVPTAMNAVSCGRASSDVKCGAACSDGTVEQTFTNGMVGCAARVPHAARSGLCGPGLQPASAAEWMANRGSMAPTYNYWTNDLLLYHGSGNACFVSHSGGGDCGSTPMRVCAGNPDPEGNLCNWLNCGFGSVLPSHFFGGCNGNNTAGGLCAPVL